MHCKQQHHISHWMQHDARYQQSASAYTFIACRMRLLLMWTGMAICTSHHDCQGTSSDMQGKDMPMLSCKTMYSAGKNVMLEICAWTVGQVCYEAVPIGMPNHAPGAFGPIVHNQESLQFVKTDGQYRIFFFACACAYCRVEAVQHCERCRTLCTAFPSQKPVCSWAQGRRS